MKKHFAPQTQMGFPLCRFVSERVFTMRLPPIVRVTPSYPPSMPRLRVTVSAVPLLSLSRVAAAPPSWNE